jgi:hypothetical protein
MVDKATARNNSATIPRMTFFTAASDRRTVASYHIRNGCMVGCRDSASSAMGPGSWPV